MTIRKCTPVDFAAVLTVINNAACAYEGVIPEDCWHEPYMGGSELARELSHGVEFWGVEQAGRLVAVMGLQNRGEVTLVRHAYVVPEHQRHGLGAKLLHHVEGLTDKPILVGTWAAASWAIRFYEKNGYVVLSSERTSTLLEKYWDIPRQQARFSVVLRRTVSPSEGR